MPYAKNRIRTCFNCGDEFSLDNKGTKEKYCSKTCANKAHYKKHGNGHQRNPRQSRSNWLKRTYGITIENFEQMLEDQGGCCKVCGSSDPKGLNFHVDHDHATGEVRAVLCALCNQAIGQVKDDIELLQKLIKYLKEYKGEQG